MKNSLLKVYITTITIYISFVILANEKLDNSKKTGDGPPPKFTECEQLLIDNSSKRVSPFCFSEI